MYMGFESPEGATPIKDCSELLLPWVQNMNDLNRVEAENISQAQRKYLKTSLQEVSLWFHIKELQTIHRAMFGFVWGWAGKPRKSVTSIGIAPGLIPLRMAELCKEVASWSTESIELTFLEKSARIHHRLVYIHPFENGNGRFSRLIADRALLAWKCPHPIWPDNLHQDGVERKKYILTLQAADKGDFEPLVSFMKNLGAANPSIIALFQDSFYRPYLEDSRGLAKIASLLRDANDPNFTTTNGHGLPQLMIRSKLSTRRKLEILKLLISRGVEVDRTDASGLTPFQVAVLENDKALADLLVFHGAKKIRPSILGM